MRMKGGPTPLNLIPSHVRREMPDSFSRSRVVSNGSSRRLTRSRRLPPFRCSSASATFEAIFFALRTYCSCRQLCYFRSSAQSGFFRFHLSEDLAAHPRERLGVMAGVLGELLIEFCECTVLI